MQIVCPSCTKRLQIPDEKLPQDRQARLVCPSCRERFTFDPHLSPTAADLSGSGVSAPSPQAPAATATAPAPAPSPGLDSTEAGPAPRAMVCLDSASHQEACQGMLPSLGYQTVHIMPHQAEALALLTEVPYEFAILDATFDGSTLEANPVRGFLLELPMERRRYMFITLCIPDVKSDDEMAAYSHGANLVLNPSDVPNCRRVLERHLTAHKRLYKVYRELRGQLGKDF